MPLNNYTELGIQQSCYIIPLVLTLNSKVPFLACIHTSDKLYSQILLVSSCRSLDPTLSVKMHFLHPSAITFIPYCCELLFLISYTPI